MISKEFRNNADAFTKAYVEEAMLWSTSAELGTCDDCGASKVSQDENEKCSVCHKGTLWGTDRSFQDNDFDIEDIAPETLDKITADCVKFQSDNAEYLTADNNNSNYDADEQGGHDFWLTRNGHGAGFWDGDWLSDDKDGLEGPLTVASKQFGEVYLYIGGDSLIHI